MTPKIRTAVIGVGNIGKHHVRIMAEKTNLVAIADNNREVAGNVARKYSVVGYHDYKKMLDKEQIDGITIAVPTEYHKEVVLDCLERKIPTLIEKPIANSLDSAMMMLKAAKKHHTVLMVGHVERFNPVILKLKEIIEENKLGRLISLLALRVGINPPSAQNSDVAVDLGIHDVDVFNFLLNKYPIKTTVVKEKFYKKNKADSATILLEYTDASATVQTNWMTPIKMRKLYVTGSRGFAEVDYIRQKLTLYERKKQIKNDRSYLDIISLSDIPKREIYVSKKEPLKQELVFFLKNMHNYQLLSSVESAIKALEIVTNI